MGSFDNFFDNMGITMNDFIAQDNSYDTYGKEVSELARLAQGLAVTTNMGYGEDVSI